MARIYFYSILLLSLLTWTSCAVEPVSSNSKPIHHDLFTQRKNEFDDMIPDALKYAIGGI